MKWTRKGMMFEKVNVCSFSFFMKMVQIKINDRCGNDK